jgi:hypothetical protein
MGYEPLYSIRQGIFYQMSNYQLHKRKLKAVPVLNQAPHHEDTMGKWRYSSTHS